MQQKVAITGDFQKNRNLRTLPSGAPKEEFGRMIFKKNLAWGAVLKLSQQRQQVLVGVRRGAGTCEAPCILARVLDSAFIQAIVRLNCSDSLL